MKKIEKVLMTTVKLLGSMSMVELAAAIWDYCNFGYWEWTKVQDLVPAYVVLVGAAWIGYHIDDGIDIVMNIGRKTRSRKPQFVVKGGDLERP